jgi:hypothetical protein
MARTDQHGAERKANGQAKWGGVSGGAFGGRFGWPGEAGVPERNSGRNRSVTGARRGRKYPFRRRSRTLPTHFCDFFYKYDHSPGSLPAKKSEKYVRSVRASFLGR